MLLKYQTYYSKRCIKISYLLIKCNKNPFKDINFLRKIKSIIQRHTVKSKNCISNIIKIL